MLTRIYIDNFRCFSNFEFKPRRKELIFGGNGSGKSTLCLAAFKLRQFLTTGSPAREWFFALDLSRLEGIPGSASTQRFEMDVRLDDQDYRYALTLRHFEQDSKVEVITETLTVNGSILLQFSDREVLLLSDEATAPVKYPFNPLRSALAAIPGGRGYSRIGRFITWVSQLFCFKLNPFGMVPIAGTEEAPAPDLINFASWYQAASLSLARENQNLLADLTQVIEGFSIMALDRLEPGRRLLGVEFQGTGSPRYLFSELSDGQRCLICLYSILHFLVARGATIILDEPDNFISLREIQPWLMKLEDHLDDGHGQAMLISHHPEILDQWAPVSGTQFFREDSGPVRCKPFQVHADTALSAAELIARGWLNE